MNLVRHLDQIDLSPYRDPEEVREDLLVQTERDGGRYLRRRSSADTMSRRRSSAMDSASLRYRRGQDSFKASRMRRQAIFSGSGELQMSRNAGSPTSPELGVEMAAASHLNQRGGTLPAMSVHAGAQHGPAPGSTGFPTAPPHHHHDVVLPRGSVTIVIPEQEPTNVTDV